MKILSIIFAEAGAIPLELIRQGHDVRIVTVDVQWKHMLGYPQFKDRIFVADQSIHKDLVSNGPRHILEQRVLTDGWIPELILLNATSDLVAPIAKRAVELFPTVPRIGPFNADFAKMEVDRRFFKQVCKDVQIDVPPYDIFTLNALENWIDRTGEDKLKYPLYVKPCSYAEALDSDEKYLVAKVRTDEELRSWIKTFRSIAADFPNPQVLVESCVEGYEVACGTWFNGMNFVGPWQMHLEYKRFAAGNVGPNIDEPGVHCIRINEPDRHFLVKEVKKMTKFLRERDYRGWFDINFIIQDMWLTSEPAIHSPTAYAIEPDCRFPVPGIFGVIAETNNFAGILSSVGGGDSCSQYWYPSNHVLCAQGLHIGFPFCNTMPDHFRGAKLDGLNKGKRVYNLHSGGFDESANEFIVNPGVGNMFVAVGIGRTIENAKMDLQMSFDEVKYPYFYYRTDIGDRKPPDWLMV